MPYGPCITEPILRVMAYWFLPFPITLSQLRRSAMKSLEVWRRLSLKPETEICGRRGDACHNRRKWRRHARACFTANDAASKFGRPFAYGTSIYEVRHFSTTPSHTVVLIYRAPRYFRCQTLRATFDLRNTSINHCIVDFSTIFLPLCAYIIYMVHHNLLSSCKSGHTDREDSSHSMRASYSVSRRFSENLKDSSESFSLTCVTYPVTQFKDCPTRSRLS